MYQESNIKIENLVKEADYDPIMIGKAILEKLGYNVKLDTYYYNSMCIQVFDKSGREVHSQTIGD